MRPLRHRQVDPPDHPLLLLPLDIRFLHLPYDPFTPTPGAGWPGVSLRLGTRVHGAGWEGRVSRVGAVWGQSVGLPLSILPPSPFHAFLLSHLSRPRTETACLTATELPSLPCASSALDDVSSTSNSKVSSNSAPKRHSNHPHSSQCSFFSPRPPYPRLNSD